MKQWLRELELDDDIILYLYGLIVGLWIGIGFTIFQTIMRFYA